jgi:hypothetical protein
VGERLGEVVVRPGVERLGLVELAVLGGEHQDRRPVTLGPQRGAEPEPVESREHQVEDERVVAVLPRHPETVDPVQRHVDGEAVGLQAAPQRAGQPCLVVDHQ